VSEGCASRISEQGERSALETLRDLVRLFISGHVDRPVISCGLSSSGIIAARAGWALLRK
jgi:hypothetical protein